MDQCQYEAPLKTFAKQMHSSALINQLGQTIVIWQLVGRDNCQIIKSQAQIIVPSDY